MYKLINIDVKFNNLPTKPAMKRIHVAIAMIQFVMFSFSVISFPVL